jgi:hypothetical protein
MSVKIEKDNSLSISGFSGIGRSEFDDFTDALGVNLNNSGILSVGYKFNELIRTKSAVNFEIASAGFDYFTLSTPDLTLNYGAVRLSTTGTLPTGLNTTDIFYLYDIDNDGLKFRFYTDIKDVGGSNYINLVDVGTGTHSFTHITPKEIKAYTFDKNNNLYLLDADQNVWYSDSGTDYTKFYLLEGNTSSGTGNGMVYYAGYIIVFGNSAIDAVTEISDLSSGFSWKNDITNGIAGVTISSAHNYPRKGACPFYSQFDNAVYFSNGTSVTNSSVVRVGFIEENIGKKFDPEDNTTFSIVPDAIELPNYDGNGFVQSINEIGDKIILGTLSNNVYFWDRKSILPYSIVNMPEQNTSKILVKSGSIFAFNGYTGKIYPLGESNYGEPIAIPEHLFDTDYTKDINYIANKFIDFIDAELLKEEILFSIEVSGNCYLMSYNSKTGNLIKKNISSLGELLTTGSTPGRIYKIIVLDRSRNKKNNIILSTKKEASPDVWILEGLYNGNYLQVLDDNSAYITTGIVNVGDVYNKKTFKELHLSFSRELTTGQSIKIYYRRNDNGTWTELKTISYTTDGAIKDIKVPAHITDIIDLQIKIVINGYNATTAFGTSPYLKLVRLIP